MGGISADPAILPWILIGMVVGICALAILALKAIQVGEVLCGFLLLGFAGAALGFVWRVLR